MKRSIIMSLLTFFSGLFATAQQTAKLNSGAPYTLYAEEQDLESIYTKWVECTTQHGCDQADKLDVLFAQKFARMLQRKDYNFDYPLSIMIPNEMVNLWRSEDDKLHIFNWDKFSFTSMRECYTVYQWEHQKKVQSKWHKKDPKNGNIIPTLDKISALHTVKIGDKTYYLIVKNAILSSNDISQTIECLSLENGVLKTNVPIFKTKTKQFGRISFNFLRATISDERDAFNLIVYDKNKQQILIPVVNQDAEVKDSYLVYQLKGQYFEYIGIKK